MTDQVKDINVTSLNRLDTNVAKDELKALAETFNEMLERKNKELMSIEIEKDKEKCNYIAEHDQLINEKEKRN